MRMLRILLITMILPLALVACDEDKQNAGAPPPAEVDVSQPLKKPITEWDEYTGTFQAVSEVDVRARVTGYIVEKRFRDGQKVKKGDVLFVIDPRPFNNLKERAQAQYNLALKEFKRAEGLRKTRAISQEDFDRRTQELTVAKTLLNDAKLDVEFTEVVSPINGKVSDDFINVGNLVRANETVLTNIVSVDPIHFEFEASQSELLKYIRLDRSGKRPGSHENPNPIFIKLQDESEYKHIGRMDFVDNRVDQGTGTIQGRALVANDDEVIYPGLFGRARLIGSAQYDAVLLPEKALNTDQDRNFVYTVTDDNKAVRSYIEVGPVLDNGFIIIREGLTGEERVVISGIQRIRAPEQPVTPNPIELQWVDVEIMPSGDDLPTLDQIRGVTQPDELQDEQATEQ